ncbi:MAG: hypothetical protein ACLP5J_14505 [Mycobacterium sp.]|uniref:hypothetical protein n=1 Tax=Mycobacterium sp. TaxID=1785 RepID=UPI003F989365
MLTTPADDLNLEELRAAAREIIRRESDGCPVSIFQLLDELSTNFGERFSVSPDTRKVLYLIEALWDGVDIHQVADGCIEFVWIRQWEGEGPAG